MNAKVTNLAAFRIQKETKGDRKVGVQDAFELKSLNVSAQQRPRSGPSSQQDAGHGESIQNDGFGPDRSNQALAERIERLKSSISRINALMDELRSGPESSARDPRRS
jgi:hypothetical protein